MSAHVASALGVIVVVLLGCNIAPPGHRPSPLVLVLPTVAEVPRVCLGLGGGGTLHGDPRDERVAWGEGFGNRGELVWPPGYVARVDPDLEVLDPSGNVVFREGDTLPGGCAVGPAHDPPSLVLILPEPSD